MCTENIMNIKFFFKINKIFILCLSVCLSLLTTIAVKKLLPYYCSRSDIYMIYNILFMFFMREKEIFISFSESG